MAKFKKLALLCMSILMSCMMAVSAGCSLFELMDSSVSDSSTQTQDSNSEEDPSSDDNPNSDDNPSSEDPANGGNWTGEVPLK